VSRRPIIFAVLLCLSTGCASLRALIGLGPIRPKVHVTDIQVVKASLLALDLAIGIKVDNPNDFDLDFSKMRYEIVAAGLSVAHGNYEPHIVVKERGSAEVRLPLSIDAANAVQLVRRMLEGKEDVVAVTTAVADFATSFGPMTVDFEDKRPLRKLAGF
jgi:LEA14-like dessication related protein